MGPTMQAAVVRGHGEAPEHGAHPAPRRRPGEALIQITAAPVNPLDLICASGTSYFGTPALPYVPGTQGVGVVAESDTQPVGRRVWFATTAGMTPGDGTMAQTDRLRQAAGGRVDLVIDPVWGLPARRRCACCRPGADSSTSAPRPGRRPLSAPPRWRRSSRTRRPADSRQTAKPCRWATPRRRGRAAAGRLTGGPS